MSLQDFQKQYGTEEQCQTALMEKRWGKDGNGRYCPHCGSYATYAFKDGRLFKCKDCAKQFTVKVGTIFTDSKVPLTKWYLAIYLSTSLKKGISSVQLAKYIGTTQKTAWFMLQRIRYAMEENDDGMLQGEVEVDETYIGGPPRAYEAGKRKPKAPVFGAIERGGRIKLSSVKSTGARVLIPKIKQQVRRGSLIYSDQARAYDSLSGRQYTHLSVNHGQLQFVAGLTHTQNIEAAWSHFKRSLYGVYHCVSVKHLQKYCSEFEYRYNTRTISDEERFDGWFVKLHAHLPYKELVYGSKTQA